MSLGTATVTFVSGTKDTLDFNNSSSAISAEWAPISNTGIIGTRTPFTIAANGHTTLQFPNDGLFMYGIVSGAEQTVIIYQSIYNAIKQDCHDVLVNNNIKTVLPNGYDMTTLIMLSLLFIGDNTYQLVTYNDGTNHVAYCNIQLAIERCLKHIDWNNNTPQSTNNLNS
jgi:hypothetical protein